MSILDITPGPKTIVPPPRHVSYITSINALYQDIGLFLPNTKRTKHLKGKIVGSLEKGWLIWTGQAFAEFGLQFKQQPIVKVEHLLFAKPNDDARPGLGKKSLAYLSAELAKHGLRIGQAIPPNDYD